MKTYLKFLWTSALPHEKRARYLITGLVLALILAFATQCRAGELEGLGGDLAAIDEIVRDSRMGLTAEAGVQYLRGPAAAVFVSVPVRGPRDTTIEPGLYLVGQTPDHLGVMGGQVLIVDGFGKLDLGVGLAVMNRLHEQLGSQLNFALMVRYNVTDRVYVAARHFSNSGTTEHNTGVDMVTVGWRF